MRKLHVVALMVALIYVTTWVLAAHAPRADVAHPAVVVHVGVSANPFEMGG